MDITSLLVEIRPDIDFAHTESLVDDAILDSMDILLIVTAIESHYDIKIPLNALNADNFNSAKAISDMIDSFNLMKIGGNAC